MKHSLTPRFAGIGVIGILSVTLVFHFMVLSGLIPFDITWGGRLENRQQMLVFESLSILITVAILSLVAVRLGYLKWQIPPVVVTSVFWILTGIFILNTLGNLLANNSFENILGSLLTAILAVFCWKLAVTINMGGQ